MTESFVRQRKPGGGRKKNPIATKAIRLPSPLADKILALKKKGNLEPLYRSDIGEIFSRKTSSPLTLPLFASRVQAGLPSPADDFSDGSLDLNEYLVPHKTSTFFVRATGDSMVGAGIFPGSLLVVDKSLVPSYGKIVIAVLNGEMTVKRFEKINNRLFLCSENEQYPDLKVREEDDFSIWGVVTNVIHDLL